MDAGFFRAWIAEIAAVVEAQRDFFREVAGLLDGIGQRIRGHLLRSYRTIFRWHRVVIVQTQQPHTLRRAARLADLARACGLSTHVPLPSSGRPVPEGGQPYSRALPCRSVLKIPIGLHPLVARR